MKDLLNPIIRRYEKELLGSVIPFWEKHCMDRRNGGYFTCLDRDGSIYDKDKYMWMQWRIVYMFTVMYLSEYSKDKWLKIALHGYEFLHEKGRDRSGNYYFALNEKGGPAVAPYNIFSEAFALMGCSTLYRATGEARFRAGAEQAWDNYLMRMENPKGRWNKALPGKRPFLSLGPHMILLNLGTVMNENLGTRCYDDKINSAADLILGRFWNKEKRVLFENIPPGGSFDLTSSDGRLINPGHGLEAMWFIMHHAEIAGKKAWLTQAPEITKALLEFGWDKKHGGILYMKDIMDKPCLELFHDMKLWWVHNEAVLACLYAFRLTGDARFRQWFMKIDEWAWRHFRDPAYGEWFGYLNRRGEPTHRLKGGKWKSFFHLPRCLYYSIIQMKKLTAV